MLRWLRRAPDQSRNSVALRTLHSTCRTLMSERGEADSVKFARAAISQYQELDKSGRLAFFSILAEEYAPDATEILAKAQRYADMRSAEALIELLHASEPPRQELLRRLNRAPQGTATILKMRSDLLQELAAKPHLAAVEADFHHLLSSWFNPGFLRLERVDWQSPAHLLEQIIRFEAVHEIQGWGLLRRRLGPDRRCFAFLHPALPDEPLIFVEVALTHEMPAAIAPLVNDVAVDRHTERARYAVFYSISSCQPGLRGIALGNFLIKRVCEVLKAESPRLARFCTLSPIPGFRRWLKGAAPGVTAVPPTAALRFAQAQELIGPLLGENSASVERALEQAGPSVREALLRLASFYLCATRIDDSGSDPVARFHLQNGARLARLNFLANRSVRGLDESLGLMVNYVYDLREIERNHEQFVRGRVAAARDVRNLV